jgi:hypothetical protein
LGAKPRAVVSRLPPPAAAPIDIKQAINSKARCTQLPRQQNWTNTSLLIMNAARKWNGVARRNRSQQKAAPTVAVGADKET